MLIHFKIFDKIKVLKVNHNIVCVRQKIKFAESKRGGGTNPSFLLCKKGLNK